MKILKDVLFAWMILSSSNASFGQCALTISTYPYNESFESSQGGWTSGGTLNDWAWGTPAKPVINSAASGTKCWITGGLFTAFYNYGERSWVQSPCFDFTSLAHPYITFKIFWQTEYRFDGGNLQYSLNGGNSWSNVGGYNDPVNCINAKWYNHSPVSYLSGLASVRDGWSGSGSSTGSNGWVLAKHCISYLAGEPSVIFRFAFGAGTQQNDFDGLAFDDITIQESPPLIPSFTSSCRSTHALGFTDQSSTCPNGWNWNFNDPGSGNSNIVSVQHPVHTFSTAGSFNVTLTASNGCSAPASISHYVNVINTTAVTTDPSCFGGHDGSATISVAGSGSPYSYLWNTNPVQTGATSTGLSQGTYAYYVSGNNVCGDTNEVIIHEPVQQVINLGDDSTICPGGSVELFAGVYQSYQWLDNSQLSTLVINRPGTYWVTVTDNSGCLVSDTIVFHEECLADVIAPNAFSPDGDGKNDFFFASGLNVTSFSMKIFNRWGEAIFESDAINIPWDGVYKGKDLEPDLFVWIIKFSINDRPEQEKSGSVMLIR